jgi:hypothetical protein
VNQRVLPGFQPDRQRIEVHALGDGLYSVTVQSCSGPGLWATAESDVYEDLDALELIDVVSSVLDSAWWV